MLNNLLEAEDLPWTANDHYLLDYKSKMVSKYNTILRKKAKSQSKSKETSGESSTAAATQTAVQTALSALRELVLQVT